MGTTLRRSCTACATAKLRCDLQKPCSRCERRRRHPCNYANEPLVSMRTKSEEIRTSKDSYRASSESALQDGVDQDFHPDVSKLSLSFAPHLFDPFDSYPVTSLPRIRVQGLIQHFLSKIAFQYYPLDLNPTSNPFVTAWWPLALTDPLLFHVTLQTASWDDEYRASRENGFPHSERLMRDSVSLLRHKIQDKSLAFQDATMNAVVTLAAIEHGKGNLVVSRMHIDGVKRIVDVRGGLSKVKETSPLTARMVPWVALLVTGSPQFEAQDDNGTGTGVSTIPQWRYEFPVEHHDADLLDLDSLGIDPVLSSVIMRARFIFGAFHLSERPQSLSNTVLHDLTCYTLHRLLNLHPFASLDSALGCANISECLRISISMYMLIVHGPIYYSHAAILFSLLLKLKNNIESPAFADASESLILWILSVGSVAATGTYESNWFREQAAALCKKLNVRRWADLENHLKRTLWLESKSAALFQQMWEDMIT